MTDDIKPESATVEQVLGLEPMARPLTYNDICNAAEAWNRNVAKSNDKRTWDQLQNDTRNRWLQYYYRGASERTWVWSPGSGVIDKVRSGSDEADPVNHPAHYTFGKLEVIDVIEDWKLNYNRSCVIKYVARAGRKDPTKELEDLNKARWYLDREIQRLTR